MSPEVIASERASIGSTFNRIGLHADWGATHAVPRLVGTGRAAERVFSGRMVDAREADWMRLFEPVFAEDCFQGEVRKTARELPAKPPVALKLAERTLAASLDAMLAGQGERQMACIRSADATDGITAFNEKRTPVFRGE